MQLTCNRLTTGLQTVIKMLFKQKTKYRTPRDTPGAPKRPPGTPQRTQQTPKRLQETPKRTQEAPKRLQEASKRHPRRHLGDPKSTPKRHGSRLVFRKKGFWNKKKKEQKKSEKRAKKGAKRPPGRSRRLGPCALWPSRNSHVGAPRGWFYCSAAAKSFFRLCGGP